MAAALIQAIDGQQPHLLRLPAEEGSASALEEVRYALGSRLPPPGPVVLEAGRWLLRLPDLRELQELRAGQHSRGGLFSERQAAHTNRQEESCATLHMC